MHPLNSVESSLNDRMLHCIYPHRYANQNAEGTDYRTIFLKSPNSHL
jgi:hypothetical protein